MAFFALSHRPRAPELRRGAGTFRGAGRTDDNGRCRANHAGGWYGSTSRSGCCTLWFIRVVVTRQRGSVRTVLSVTGALITLALVVVTGWTAIYYGVDT
jgi:hypothetical protein